MELFILYLWLKLDSLQGLLIAGACGTAAVALISLKWSQSSLSYAEDRERFVKIRKYWPRTIAIFLAFLLPSILIPSKTDVAVLVGGHYALKLADTPEASKVMSLLRKKANDLLDEELKEKTK